MNGAILKDLIRRVRVLWPTSDGSGIWNLGYFQLENVFHPMQYSWRSKRILLCSHPHLVSADFGRILEIRVFQEVAEELDVLMQFGHSLEAAQFFMPVLLPVACGKQQMLERVGTL